MENMSEQEIDQKLKDFRGILKEMDVDQEKQLGQLMLKPEDEDINPDSETYSRLLELTGGKLSFLLYVLFILF